MDIRQRLFEMQDLKYKDFQGKLIPGIDPDTIIGVRIPALRRYAKELFRANETELFLKDLPHLYYDENNLHGYIIEQTRDFSECVGQIETFLPYVDNWATCDTMAPKVFKKNRHALLPYIEKWICSGQPYTIRFAVNMLMRFFLDDDFETRYLDMAAAVQSEEYYVKMVIAWYFATALAKQYESTLPYIEGHVLEKWTHNKTIQKARESYRIADDRKEYLKSLKAI